jgi:hypothetical protein
MTRHQTMIATLVWMTLAVIVYLHAGWKNIRHCYQKWFTTEYWTNYNIVEAISWAAKAVILVPGLIFHHDVWQFYFITLVTSLSLIWASNRKLLPTLVGFNTLWAWISCMVLAQHLI